jgi:hypothetical protein
MKRGRGINGRDDRSSGIEIRMADALAKINPAKLQDFFSFLADGCILAVVQCLTDTNGVSTRIKLKDELMQP